MAPQTWQSIAQEAQQHRDDKLAQIQPPVPEVPSDLPANVIPLPEKLLSKREIELTSKPITQLLASLSSGEVSSVEVVNAFLRRAGLAQKFVRSPEDLGFILPVPAVAECKIDKLRNGTVD